MSLGKRFYNLLSGLEAANLGPEMFVRPDDIDTYEDIVHDDCYYIGKADKELWASCLNAMPDYIQSDIGIVEFGPGDTEEVRKILPIVKALRSTSYTALDYSGEAIQQALNAIRSIKDDIEAIGVHEDYLDNDEIAANPANGIMAGITIGNLPLPILRREPVQEFALLFQHLIKKLNGGSLFFTADMKLPHLGGEFYTRAYSHKCHALFNLSVMHRIAMETDIRNFDPAAFRYAPFFNERASQLAHLAVSTKTQNIILAGEKFTLNEGEALHLQNSFKLKPETMDAALVKAGLETINCIRHETPIRLYVVGPQQNKISQSQISLDTAA